MLRLRMLALAMLVGLGPSEALARTWNSASGAFKIDAELIEKRADGTVILKRADGTSVETKAEKLSKADQDYIRQWTPGGDAAKEAPAKEIEAPKTEEESSESGTPLNPEAAAAIGKIKSAAAKAAVQAYEEADKKLSAAQAAKQKDYRDKLAGMLEEALKEATAAGNLDDALAIRNAVKALRGGQEPPLPVKVKLANGAPERGATVRQRTVKGRISANCDDSFIMCVNGKEVLRGDQSTQVYVGDYEFAKGDVITVRVHDNGGTRGFACAIKLQSGRVITTSPKWSAYQPKSTEEWFKHENAALVKGAQPPKGDAISGGISKQLGIAAANIWGLGNPGYLMFVMP